MKSYVSGLAKNKIKKSTGYFTGFLFLLIVMISGQKACAAVTVGEPGKTYSGEYVVIVNAGTEDTENTGTLTFTESVASQNLAVQSAEADSFENYVIDSGTADGEKTYAVNEQITYQTGSQRTFYTYAGYRTFTCIGVGAHCYIWMEDNLKTSYDTAGKTSLIAGDMAQTYEQGAYETLKEISGGTIPCRDGSGKLSIALEEISSASGVYMGRGNEPDITAIHINVRTAAEYTVGSMRTTNALLVHEGQHALFEQFTSYDYTQKYMGINEGLSVAAMEYAWGNSNSSNWLDYIKGNHAIQNGSALLYRFYRNSSAQDYGLPYLFIRYLINRKSGDYDLAAFYHAVYAVNASNKTAGAYLQAVMGIPFEDLVTDFYTAIAANEPSGKYGFEGDAVVQSTVNQYPYYVGGSGSEVDLEPTAAIILNLGKGGSFTVPVNGGSHIRYRIVGEKNSTLSSMTGSGTAEDPYQISSVKDWNQMANQPGAHYKLMKDLNFNGKAVTTIGTFSGELDGNEHCINGVSHSICVTNTGKIANLQIEANMAGVASNYYGMIAQYNQGVIDHCTVGGKINAALYGQYTWVGTYTGAVVGLNEEAGKIQYCTVTAEMNLTASELSSRNGGIAGANRGYIVNGCFKGILSVEQPVETAVVYTGGIAGETGVNGGIGGSIKQSVNAGVIRVNGGNEQTGQICGHKLLNAYFQNCYGKANGIPLFGTEELDAKQADSKKLTEEEWKNSNSFAGLDFETGWKMGENGPEMSGADRITTIELAGQPTWCYVGEELYQWGSLKVNDSYYVPITSDMVGQFDSSRKGDSLVLIKYMGKVLSYNIQVKEPMSVQSLRISGRPAKASYTEGENFDPEGILLLARIDGEAQERYIRSGFIWNQTALKATDTAVVLQYYGNSVEVPITVTGKTSEKPGSGNNGESDEKPDSGNSGTSGQKPATGNNSTSSGNTGTSDKTQVTGNISTSGQKQEDVTATFVKLNATNLPLQVKKSTSVLKVKEWSAGDCVAGWSSSNKKVATVNARTGKITAKKTGKATITVTMRSGATAKCLIKVQKGKVRTKKITLGKTAIILKKGEKYRIVWEKQPLTSGDKVSFASAKKKIASVSGKGVITAKKKGTTYITVKSGSKKRKIKVTVR